MEELAQIQRSDQYFGKIIEKLNDDINTRTFDDINSRYLTNYTLNKGLLFHNSYSNKPNKVQTQLCIPETINEALTTIKGVCVHKSTNINLQKGDIVFISTPSGKNSHKIGPFIVGYLHYNDIGQLIGIGLLDDSLKPIKHWDKNSNIVPVEYIKKCYVLSNNIVMNNVRIDQIFTYDDWLPEKFTHKLKNLFNKSNKARNKVHLPNHFFFMDHIKDSKIQDNVYKLLISWKDNIGNNYMDTWIDNSKVCDKQYIINYLVDRYLQNQSKGKITYE